MIFGRATITIEYNNYIVRVTAKMLHVAKITGCNLLQSLTLFPLHHVEKSSAINNETEAGLVDEVDRLCQILKTSVIKVYPVCLYQFFYLCYL